MYKTRTGHLVAGLLLAPFIAGTLGGILVALSIATLVPIEQWAGEIFMEFLFFSLIATMIGVVAAYLLAGMPMLVVWAIAHFLQWRSPAQIGLMFGLGGTSFSFVFFIAGLPFGGGGVNLDTVVLVATLPCGFVAGFVSGWVIAKLGYDKVVIVETVSPREA